MADSCAADEVITRARALLGTCFRLHGRDPSTGLDCVGLVAAAYDVRGTVPTGYPLRGGQTRDYVAIIDKFAPRRVSGPPRPGDILFIAISSTQHHLGLWTGYSLIHAHAGLRSVVETPGIVRDNIIAAWSVSRDVL